MNQLGLLFTGAVKEEARRLNRVLARQVRLRCRDAALHWQGNFPQSRQDFFAPVAPGLGISAVGFT